MKLYYFLGALNGAFAMHYWLERQYLLFGIAFLAWLACLLTLYKKNEMSRLESDSDEDSPFL